MAYKDIYAAVNDEVFRGRCQVAMWKAAQDIANEPDTTPHHQERRDWATRVLQDHANITPRQLVMQVLRNPVIAGDVEAADDGALQYQVNTILDDLIRIG